MLLEILVETVLMWSFHVALSSINTPKNLVTVSLSVVMPSMTSSGNFIQNFQKIKKQVIKIIKTVLKKTASSRDVLKTLKRMTFVES